MTRLLEEIARIDARRANLRDTIETIREALAAIRSSWSDGAPRGTAISDPTAARAMKLVDRLESYEAELRQVELDLWEKRRHIIGLINKVEDAKGSRLLYLRYVSGMSWAEIGMELDLSERHLYRLEEAAVQEFNRIAEEEENGQDG